MTVTLVIAHRGASVERPENTLSAFRRAMELGADGVELDVQASADARLVVMHDVTLDRTTSGSGSVATWRAGSLPRGRSAAHRRAVRDSAEGFTAVFRAALTGDGPPASARRSDRSVRATVEEWMPWDVHLLRTRALVELVEAQIVHFAAQHVDAAIVAVVDSWGYGLHAADVADRDLDRVLELGVTRLTTNNPGLAIARRAARTGAG